MTQLSDQHAEECSPDLPSTIEALWGAITSEPTTGLTIVGVNGVIYYANDQAAHIYFNEDTSPDEVLGRNLREFYSSDYLEERLRYIRQVAATDKPLMVRGMWQGSQYYAYLYPVDCDEAVDLIETQDRLELSEGDLKVDRVMIIARRMGVSVDQVEVLANAQGVELVQAEEIDLGELEVLSPRELVVLALLGQGLSLQEAAERCHRSVKTIQRQREDIGKKLQIRNRGELISLVNRVGLTLRDAERRS